MAFGALYAIAAFYNLDIEQMDVKTVFFLGIIDQLLYVVRAAMERPGVSTEYGIIRLETITSNLVQAPCGISSHQTWNLPATRRSQHFVTPPGVQGPIITTFVDDLNIFAPEGSGIMKRIKGELAAAFDMVDMGPLAFYVGLKVTRDFKQRTIELSQLAILRRYLTDVEF